MLWACVWGLAVAFLAARGEAAATSYLLDGEWSRPGQGLLRPVVRDTVAWLFRQQHPSYAQCQQRRLLVVDLQSPSVEGLGSLLKQVTYTLAAAVHSNRTLVWGAAPPYLFEHTRDLRQSSPLLTVGDINLACTGRDHYGGAFECFFHPLSSCTLVDHTTAPELSEFTQSMYNHSARLFLSDTTQTVIRTASLYHPPAGLWVLFFGPVVGFWFVQTLIYSRHVEVT
jgi:hypothetical protein